MEALNWSHNAASPYNIEDWNRIEQWTEALADQLHTLGYVVEIHPRGAVWQEGDKLTLAEVDRIRRNVDALQAGFYSLPDWREIVYDNTLGYEQANALEWDLHALYDWLSAMVSSFQMRQAGTIFMQAGGILNA